MGQQAFAQVQRHHNRAKHDQTEPARPPSSANPLLKLQRSMEEHKRRFESYNGVVRQPIDARGCGKDGAKNALDTEAERIHDDESAARQEPAKLYSGKLDPFVRAVDFEGCDKS